MIPGFCLVRKEKRQLSHLRRTSALYTCDRSEPFEIKAHTGVCKSPLTPNSKWRSKSWDNFTFPKYFHSFIHFDFFFLNYYSSFLPKTDICLNKWFRSGRGNICNLEWIYTLSETFYNVSGRAKDELLLGGKSGKR